MSRVDYILTIFKELFPDEYDIIGKSTSQNLISNAITGSEMQFVTSDKGSSLDIMPLVEQSFIIIQGIAAIIQIIQFF